MKVLKNRDIYNFLILLSYILFFLFLSFSGHYRIFVKKFYFPYILIGTLILFSILLVTLKRLKTFREISVSDISSFIVFIFPLILVSLVRPTNLPIYAALKRGIQTEFISENILKSLREKIETEGIYKKLNIKQLLAFTKSKPDEINGKDVIVEGMVFKEDKNKEFTLIRFLITCCAADATPLGVTVEYKEEEQKKIDLKNEEWVKVKGKVKIENNKIKIIAEEIEKTIVPSDPYLY